MSAYGLRHVRFCARYGVIDACNLCLHVKMSSFLHKNSVKIVTVELVDLKCKFVVLLSVHVHDPRKIHVDLHIYLIKPLCLSDFLKPIFRIAVQLSTTIAVHS